MRICSVSQSVHEATLDQKLFVRRQNAAHFSWAWVHLQQWFSSSFDGQRHWKDTSTCTTTRQANDTRHFISGAKALCILFFTTKVSVCLWFISIFHHGTYRLHSPRLAEHTHTSISYHGKSQLFSRRHPHHSHTHQDHPIWEEKVAYPSPTHQFSAVPSGGLLSISQQ